MDARWQASPRGAAGYHQPAAHNDGRQSGAPPPADISSEGRPGPSEEGCELIPKKILVPYRGTPQEERLLRSVCKTALAHRARLTVVRVLEVPMALQLDASNPPGKDRAEEHLQQARAILASTGIKAETCLLPAREAGPAIVAAAQAQGADLIVLEAPSEKPPGQSSLGRTVEYLLKKAPCEVWVSRLVRQAEGEAQ